MDAANEALLASFADVVREPDAADPGRLERLRGCTAILSLNGHGADDITPELLCAAEGVELVCIAHSWGHFEQLERESGVRVVEGSNAGTRAVAEWVLAAALIATRRLHRFDRALKQGSPWGEPRHSAGFLADKVVGVIGLGRTGRYVASAFRHLGVEVLAHTLSDATGLAAALDVRLVSLEELLRRADIVSLHHRPSDRTKNLLGAQELALMKDGGFLINSSHASLYDESALVAELERGRLAACIDVFEPEPLARDHPFRRLGNVLITPHIAANNAAMFLRCGREAIETLMVHATSGHAVDRRHAFP
jgi:phosphoglycerate dehydrogenase-like enzyme